MVENALIVMMKVSINNDLIAQLLRIIRFYPRSLCAQLLNLKGVIFSINLQKGVKNLFYDKKEQITYNETHIRTN